ncbi:stage III sporulation protein AG [Sutcliffiella cohnii]|uniref:stage III sporulation protein AG n=1 Tax=Sutcliffiella cohnii TaxID=33932 RepID=UPI002E212DD6|nr:stage III sporulation protein AG [Sutcliffiella cohnii]MED4017075.1 stage III sporulation protein AG [Sutcliffiella cohnii]
MSVGDKEKSKDFIPWLKGLLSSGDKKSTKFQYMLVVLTIGVGLMLFSNLFFGESNLTANPSVPTLGSVENENDNEQPAFSQKNTENTPMTISDYERHYENQLKEAIEAMQGVEEATVVVNVDASELKVLQTNKSTHNQKTEETDRDGGKRDVEDVSKDEQVVITRSGNDEQPIIIETKKPPIRGVLIVAQGAESITIKQMIVEAVTRVLDVPQHKVAVVPKKTKGE